jgi:hypothetical protein
LGGRWGGGARELLKVRDGFYNLDYLVKFVEHVGQREVGALREDTGSPRPIFDEFRYVELFFLDGSRVALDAAQTEAFRRAVVDRGPVLDLDRVDEEALGRVLVRDSEAGDVIMPREALEADGASRPVPPAPVPRPLGDPGPLGPDVGSITQDGM